MVLGIEIVEHRDICPKSSGRAVEEADRGHATRRGPLELKHLRASQLWYGRRGLPGMCGEGFIGRV